MTPRVVISLCKEEREALIKLALLKLRTPSDQAHYMIRHALRKLGLLPSMRATNNPDDQLIEKNEVINE